jgi:hypothetical protein
MKVVRSISNPSDIRKVNDADAAKAVSNGTHAYASKEAWKKEVRDIDKPVSGDTIPA